MNLAQHLLLHKAPDSSHTTGIQTKCDLSVLLQFEKSLPLTAPVIINNQIEDNSEDTNITKHIDFVPSKKPKFISRDDLFLTARNKMVPAFNPKNPHRRHLPVNYTQLQKRLSTSLFKHVLSKITKTKPSKIGAQEIQILNLIISAPQTGFALCRRAESQFTKFDSFNKRTALVILKLYRARKFSKAFMRLDLKRLLKILLRTVVLKDGARWALKIMFLFLKDALDRQEHFQVLAQVNMDISSDENLGEDKNLIFKDLGGPQVKGDCLGHSVASCVDYWSTRASFRDLILFWSC